MMYNKKALTKPIKRLVPWNDIKLMVFDCDGVLTDGRFIYGSTNLELKHFHGHDGLGFKLLQKTDIIISVISGRGSEALERRCKDLNITYLFQNVANKLQCLDNLLKELNLIYTNVAYMGDDWNDVPVMQKVAFSAAPADAQPDVAKIVDWVSEFKGGQGAARDMINYVLTRKGIYEKTVLAYLDSIG
ncbi:MAG TPA: HAD-IIIA family hydrolase [Candidatus Cloacimonas sp.]|nr:MAG: 3-deoxy-D-manno-octulosonate 8-phosphate phosphatase KdsC [Candidatus Cloacimonetes bacterium ADurb.Bin089]HNW24743.1 HAD-IIIA family hydrolase [Candidatus Cloacimonas sp.]